MAGYRALAGDAAAEVMRLVSRDLDRAEALRSWPPYGSASGSLRMASICCRVYHPRGRNYLVVWRHIWLCAAAADLLDLALPVYPELWRPDHLLKPGGTPRF